MNHLFPSDLDLRNFSRALANKTSMASDTALVVGKFCVPLNVTCSMK